MNELEGICYFGNIKPINDLSVSEVAKILRETEDHQTADQLETHFNEAKNGQFSSQGILSFSFSKFFSTVHLCGFMPLESNSTIVPAMLISGEKKLVDIPLTISLCGLHVANYPGGGTHNILFDFVVHNNHKKTPAFHYNTKLLARDGESVAIQNVPLFRNLKTDLGGLTFGFQTINLKSSNQEKLLNFLNGKSFKQGLSLINDTDPVLGQFSTMAASIASWTAEQSRNTKVQEFKIGLDFNEAQLSAGLSEGYYVIAQIPKSYEHDFDWGDWKIDTTLVRLVNKENSNKLMEFNHIIIGISKTL